MQISRSADQDTTTWTLTIDGTTASWLSVWTANGEICSVDTLGAHQRQGYAATLYRHATAETAIYHTIAAHRSAEGSIFAARVGGEEIDESDAVVIDDCCCDHCDA